MGSPCNLEREAQVHFLSTISNLTRWIPAGRGWFSYSDLTEYKLAP